MFHPCVEIAGVLVERLLTCREVPETQEIIDATETLHPNMKERLLLWSIGVDEKILLRNYKVRAVKFGFDDEKKCYSFTPEQFEALMKSPVSPIWTSHKCNRCKVQGDKRLLAAECMHHPINRYAA